MTMPSSAARRLYEDQIPSFMSVLDPETTYVSGREVVPTGLSDSKKLASTHTTSISASNQSTHLSTESIQQQSSRVLTPTSDSVESSPTTTLSTSDFSPLSDPSPSSPESPVNLPTLKPFPTSRSFGIVNSLSTLSVSGATMISERPMTSPVPRRPRNMKNLSIMPPLLSSVSASQNASEPASPSFIKPKIPVMKRKPSNLSLNTNTKELINKALEMPMSPGLGPIMRRRALKHSVSTPHMLTGLKSSTFAPPGGMTFHTVLERNESGLSEVLRPSNITVPPPCDFTIEEEHSPIKSQVAGRGEFDIVNQLRDESENNEDQKSPTYPEGPIAIYDNDVYLYLEPNAEEASRFDVVINVAREVKNPFADNFSILPLSKSLSDFSPCPDTAATDASFATAFEFPQTDSETPVTPKAATPQPRIPEYIHMPWDHNTDIAVDLMQLCEKIDRSVKEGKKVLIHCQQGASRSASLIIAYGLYRNPELSVNDAYYAAQAKSRWISPNMKLMYCLQDFQKEITAKRKPLLSAFRQRVGRSPTKHRLTLSADIASTSISREPLTAPFMSDSDSVSPGLSPNGCSPMRLRGNSTPTSMSITPGPSSAPSSFSWSEVDDDHKEPRRFPRFELKVGKPSPTLPTSQTHAPRVTPELRPVSLGQDHSDCSQRTVNFSRPITWSKPPPSPGFSPMGMSSFGSIHQSIDENLLGMVPVERQIASFPDDSSLMSPRAEVMTNNPLRESFAQMPKKNVFTLVESPPTPNASLFSPHEGSFPRDPFSFRPSQVADPRSPPTKGETPIVRSIDELL